MHNHPVSTLPARSDHNPANASRRNFLKGSAQLGAALLLPGLLTGCNNDNDNDSDHWWNWPLERKISQMLLVGFRGIELTDDNPIVRDIRDDHIGGVILFDRDVALKQDGRNITSPEQLPALTASLNKLTQTPLFIAVDQEGGNVARLKERYGFPPTVTAQSLGTADDLALTAPAADSIANTLVENGLNLNFAPVVDVNINPASPAIGKYERSFSADPAVVTRHAGEFVARQRERGVMSALKHFPGHGSATADSHLGFVDVTETWSEIELEPYRNLIDADLCDMVMTAHIYKARLDADYPATLSRSIMTGLLREQLGFQGVIVTDDLQMAAIAEYYSYETAIIRTIEAGVDILLVANNLSYDPDIVPKTLDIVLGAVARGELDPQRIDESCSRIMALKGQYRLL